MQSIMCIATARGGEKRCGVDQSLSGSVRESRNLDEFLMMDKIADLLARVENTKVCISIWGGYFFRLIVCGLLCQLCMTH